MMSIEVKKLNYVAILALISLVVLYGGSGYALVNKMIAFSDFLAAVGTPTGILVGWLAKSLSIPTTA